jgi:hypothetical protein
VTVQLALLLVVASLLAFSSNVEASPPFSVALSSVANHGTASSSPRYLTSKQETSQLPAAQAVKSPSLPSPFLVVAWILGLVAFFGALLSFFLRRHRGSRGSDNKVVERFWAIDLSQCRLTVHSKKPVRIPILCIL